MRDELLVTTVIPATPGNYCVSVSMADVKEAHEGDDLEREELLTYETIIGWHVEIYRRAKFSGETYQIVNPVFQTGDDMPSGRFWAYIAPDGRLTNCDGWWPNLNSFLAEHVHKNKTIADGN